MLAAALAADSLLAAGPGASPKLHLTVPAGTARCRHQHPAAHRTQNSIAKHITNHTTGFARRYYALHGINILLLIARMLKRMDFQPRLGVVTRSLALAGPDLAHFALVAGVVFIGYAMMAHLIFGNSIASYATFQEAVNTNFVILLGTIDVNAELRALPGARECAPVGWRGGMLPARRRGVLCLEACTCLDGGPECCLQGAGAGVCPIAKATVCDVRRPALRDASPAAQTAWMPAYLYSASLWRSTLSLRRPARRRRHAVLLDPTAAMRSLRCKSLCSSHVIPVP